MPERKVEPRATMLVGGPADDAAPIACDEETAGHQIHFDGRLYYWPTMECAVQREPIRTFGERVIPALSATDRRRPK